MYVRGALVGAICAVALTTTWLSALGQGPDERAGTNGPVHFLEGAQTGFAAGMATDAPAAVAFGITSLRNDGGLPVTFDSAYLTPVGATDGAAVDALVLPPDARQVDKGRAGVARWPNKGYQRRVATVHGFVLDPGVEVQVLFIVHVGRTGTYYWTRPTVLYQANGARYQAVSGGDFSICPARTDCLPQP